MKMNLSVLKGNYGVCRLSPDESIPSWATAGEFYTLSKTLEELSITCELSFIPDGIQVELGWRVMKVEGPLDFALIGILAALSGTLADRGVSIFAISTFDTDYLLVKEKDYNNAVEALRDAGHIIIE
ncbi:ACT domain-containing protein [Gottschalkiaceae bacterium SANA]|nr:ACT domain-containing protein [Gottschalkiaceae bacterium SANA]